MRINRSLRSVAGLALLSGVVLMGAGCSWFRQKVDYGSSPESRPLEVPPELSAPATDPAMSIPSPGPVADTKPVAAESSKFALGDSAESAWRRVGLALQRIEGVEITTRAEALLAYDVRFAGEQFLIKVTAKGEGSEVDAVAQAGGSISGGAASRLLGLLKARLG